MAPQDYLSVLRSRIDEIDGLLVDRDKLVEEREHLWAVVRLKEPNAKTQVRADADRRSPQGTGNSFFAEAATSMGIENKGSSAPDASDHQREVNAAMSVQKRSKTEQVLGIAVEHVRQAGGEISFNDLFKVVPAEIIGEGRFAREHVRSIIQRAGERVGLVYEAGKISLSAS